MRMLLKDSFNPVLVHILVANRKSFQLIGRALKKSVTFYVTAGTYLWLLIGFEGGRRIGAFDVHYRLCLCFVWLTARQSRGFLLLL